jgi:hypothetical protein
VRSPPPTGQPPALAAAGQLAVGLARLLDVTASMPGFVAGVPRFRLGFRWFSFDDFYVKFLWKKDRKRYVFGCCHVRFKEKRPIDDSASAVCLVKIRKRRSEPIANGIIIRCSESLTNISRVPQCACRNVSPLCRTLFKQNYPILRRRNSGYPEPPPQTRTCGFPASGSSVVLAFARARKSCQHQFSLRTSTA